MNHGHGTTRTDSHTPAAIASSSPIRVCARCGIRYDWRRSPSSSLKMTYCGALCERGALGFTIDALLKAERAQPLDEAFRNLLAA
jgi:hypothetical protein